QPQRGSSTFGPAGPRRAARQGRATDDLAAITRHLTAGYRDVSGQSADPENGAEMARVLYTAEATVTGGRANGHGRTTDGVLDVQLRAPKEMGGEGGGTNPEQLFAVGYAA